MYLPTVKVESQAVSPEWHQSLGLTHAVSSFLMYTCRFKLNVSPGRGYIGEGLCTERRENSFEKILWPCLSSIQY